MPVWLIVGVTAIYMAGLFAIAWKRDAEASRPGFEQHPLIYALALAVYCTSWTYFGAVGTAASSGWDYLPIYLGPIIVFLVFTSTIRRIGDVAQRESVTSLSDFLSSRYGKSQSLAALASLAAVVGSLPYIALQLKSVGMSFDALANRSSSTMSSGADETVLIVALALAAFAILFGTRNPDKTSRNPGLMRVLAFESIVKLSALLAVAILAIRMMDGLPDAELERATQSFEFDSLSQRFVTITLLSMGAIICLPRQFHVAIIERYSQKDIATARWAFPLYLVATCVAVIPITIAGLGVLPASTSPDLFVIVLPMTVGDGFLALAIFLGGVSAATGMVIVSTIALSTMVTNDIILPAVLRSGRLSAGAQDLGRTLNHIRRGTIIGLIVLAYGYFRLAGDGAALAQIGLLSFAAAIQFAPALLGGIYWRGGHRNGAVLGLAAGMGVWLYTLFLPAILGIEAFNAHLPAFLHPHALLGLTFGDSLTHGVIWSLGANIVIFIFVSLESRERLRDRIQASAFVDRKPERIAEQEGSNTAPASISPNGLRTLASRFLSGDAVVHAFDKIAEETNLQTVGDQPADWQLVQHTERLLSGALGASSARVVMSSAVGGMDVALGDVLSILDEATMGERFDRHMLQSMLENISQGISVVDHEQNLVAWNSAYVSLFNYPKELIQTGQPIADLIRYNAKTGWIRGEDPNAEADRRISHMKAGRAHTFERMNPDGRYLRIVGNPMPGGGYVTTFTDITEDKHREDALVDANARLEQRVFERTSELKALNDKLEDARLDAEGANASKTRFLAAASHDLLQPLNAARLFLGAAQTDTATIESEVLQSNLMRADRAIQAADELLKGLLNISRLDHGRIEPGVETLPLGPLLEDLVDEASPMAEEAGLNLTLAPTSLTVRADPDFLQSIIRNFISNARRYTRRGGILVGARRRGSNVVIQVWDTGPGIAEDRLLDIFEEFKRYHETDNLGIRGAGLGLSVVKRLADLMDAIVSVRSEIGRGSVFEVSVPNAGASAKPPKRNLPTKTTSFRSLQGLAVLAIDDEETVRSGMGALLSGWGCEVDVYGSVDLARGAFRRKRYDALIADLQLNDTMTGLELIAEGRELILDPMNVALLTARQEIPVRETCSAENIELLTKPVDPDSIRDFLSECLARKVNQSVTAAE